MWNNSNDIVMVISGLVSVSVEILQPFVLGCDTKNAKVVQLCLTSIQRLISHEAISMVRFHIYSFIVLQKRKSRNMGWM